VSATLPSLVTGRLLFLCEGWLQWVDGAARRCGGILNEAPYGDHPT